MTRNEKKLVKKILLKRLQQLEKYDSENDRIPVEYHAEISASMRDICVALSKV